MRKHYTKSEKYIERKLKERIRAAGGMCIKLSDDANGLPDRLCLMPEGSVFFVEVKSRGEKLRPLQRHQMKQLDEIGFKTYVIDNVKDINILISIWEKR